MSTCALDRRRFLTLCLALLLAPPGRQRADADVRTAGYDVDVGILYRIMSFELAGTLTESVDPVAGRYLVVAAGRGSNIANRVESRGERRGGRWAPVEASSWFEVAGRQSRTELRYDYARRSVEYHYRGETFLLRRPRVADDLVAIPDGMHLDDVISAVLNFAEGSWKPDGDGSYRTHIVRRRRPENEGPDDVQRFYRAELIPFRMTLTKDPETSRPSALIDLAPFSSWARAGEPARVIFGWDRRPVSIACSLILGTSVSIRLKGAAS